MTPARGTSVLSLCLAGCAAGASHAPPTAAEPPQATHGPANAHMNHATFEDLVARFEDPAREGWQKPGALIAKLGPLAGKTVADLGAGTGYFSRRLAEQGANVLAVDVDPRFVDYIASRKATVPSGDRITPRLASFDDAGLAPATVDLVLMVDVYHHIESREAYFRRLLPALRPHGSVFVVDFKQGNVPVGPPAHLKVAPEQVVKELAEAGYVDPTIDLESLPYQFIVQVSAPR